MGLQRQKAADKSTVNISWSSTKGKQFSTVTSNMVRINIKSSKER